MDTPVETTKPGKIRRFLFHTPAEEDTLNGEAVHLQAREEVVNDPVGKVCCVLEIVACLGIFVPICYAHMEWFLPVDKTPLQTLSYISTNLLATLFSGLLFVWEELGWFLGPLVVGILVAYYSWHIVYLDSYIPGRVPPTPFSPNHVKKTAGSTFHLNYLAAIGNGILVFFFLLWRSLQYHTPEEETEA